MSTSPLHARPLPARRLLARQLLALRQFWARQQELRERLRILDQPWTHDQLHWHLTDEGQRALHGEHPAPRGGRGPSTRGGWCPCQPPALDDLLGGRLRDHDACG